MYSILKRTGPSYMCNFELIGHSYGTRKSKLSFVIPHVNTQGSYSFKFCGIKLWNELPLNIKNSVNKSEFKSKCKTFLFDKMKRIENSDFTQ